MGKKIYLILYFLFLCGFSHSENLHDFGEKAFFTFITNDYEKLFSMFYIPAGYEKENLKNDKEAIVEWAKFVIKKLGSIRNFSQVDRINQPYLRFTICPGPFDELKDITGKFVVYRVQFSSFGDGYLAFEIINIGANLYLKNVVLILPESNPRSIEVYRDAFKFMTDLIKKQKGD